MSAVLGKIRRTLLGIPPKAMDFEHRGFHIGGRGARLRLGQVTGAFAAGYHVALEAGNPAELPPALSGFSSDLEGFAFEGAAMGLALLDFLTPWRRDRLRDFLQGAGSAHVYMVHVGAGWVLASRRGNIARCLAQFDPLLRWLVVDGYGFREGFFHWPRYAQGRLIPSRLAGYERRAFDQGLGRCLWFIEGGDVDRIPKTISSFPSERHADLWGGVGLAATYAGGIDRGELDRLRESASAYRPCLAQGAAFAAKARQRAKNLVAYTDTACEALCGVSAGEAARITDDALAGLPSGDAEPAYETWRRRIQARFS